MKNRKFVVIAFLLIAAMVLGIGYATLTTTLTIIGNATIDFEAAGENFNEKIYFLDNPEVVSTTGSSSKADVASLTTEDDATFTVHSLAVKGEKAKFKFTIKNESNVAAKVLVNATKLSGADNPSNSNPTFFAVTYEYSNDDMIIASQGTMDVTVTVEVISPVVDPTSATFGLELVATTDTTAVAETVAP